MKHYFLTLAMLISLPVLGDDLHCTVRNANGGEIKMIDISVIQNGQEVDPILNKFQGYSVSVVYQTPSPFEKQSLLTLTANEASSQVYNVSEKGIYQLINKTLLVSCYFD